MKTTKHLFYLIIICTLLFSCGNSNALKQEQAKQTIKSFLSTNAFETDKEIISVKTIEKIDFTNMYSQLNTSVKVHFSGKPVTNDTHLLFIFTKNPENKWFLESIETGGEVSPALVNWLNSKKKLHLKVVEN